MPNTSQDTIADHSSFVSDLVMSSPPSASKLSDVLEILSEESEDFFPRISVGAVYSLAVERDKQVFTDAVHYCMVLLKQSNRFTSRKSDVLSLEATLMGHEMFERIIGINVQMDVETEGEAFAYSGQLQDSVKQEPETDYPETSPCNEQDLKTTIKKENKEQNSPTMTMPAKSATMEQQQPRRFTRSLGPMVVEIPQETMQDFLRHSESHFSELSPSNSDDKQLPPSPVSLSGSDHSADHSSKGKPGPKSGSHNKVIPLELKKKVLSLVRKNPDWSLQRLRKEARMPNLKSTNQVKIWARQIDGGGTKFDRTNKINNLTYEKFLEARGKSQTVTADLIRQWAVQAARDLYGSKFKFEATGHWSSTFKKLYNLQWNAAANGYLQKNEEEVMKAARSAMKKRRTLRSGGRTTSDGL